MRVLLNLFFFLCLAITNVRSQCFTIDGSSKVTAIPGSTCNVIRLPDNAGITSIDIDSFDSVIGLTSMDLGKNRIPSLPFTKSFSAITTFKLGDNPLPDTSYVQYIPNIKYLSLGGYNSKLKSISFPHDFPSLQTLNLGHHGITDLSFFINIPNLRELKLGFNPIPQSEIVYGTFSSLTNLQILTIDNCEFTKIPNGVFKGTKLITLRLIYSTITLIEANVFDDTPNLRVFSLRTSKRRGTPLNTLIMPVFNLLPKTIETITLGGIIHQTPFDKNTFQGLTNLRSISFTLNEMAVIPTGFFSSNTNLKYFSCTENDIQKLETATFSSLSELTYLSFYDNSLSEVEWGLFDNMDRLKTLKMAQNAALSCLAPNYRDPLTSLQNFNDIPANFLDQQESYYAKTGQCTAPNTQWECRPGGQHTCICLLGFYENTGVCTACPPSYGCAYKATVPTQCSLGDYCPGGTIVNDCPAGYYCSDPSKKDICPAGFYCPVRSTSPIACTSPSSCLEGSVNPRPCPHSHFCETPATRVLCQPHNYCPTNSTEEKPCPGGYYCINNWLSPIPCRLGNYCPPGSKSERPCSVGSYCPANSFEDLPCPAGSYCTDPSSKAQCTTAGEVCPAGSVGSISCLNKKPDTLGTNTCVDCGQYKLCTNGVETECGQNKMCVDGNESVCTPGMQCIGKSGKPTPCGQFKLCTNGVETECGQNKMCVDGNESVCTPGLECIEKSGKSTACPLGHKCINGESTVCLNTTIPDSINNTTCIDCPVEHVCEGGLILGECNVEAFEVISGVLYRRQQAQFNYIFNCSSIDLSNQGIERISNDTFDGFVNLIHLDLSKNNITTINPNTFDGAPQLDIESGNLLLDKKSKCTGFAFIIKDNLLYRNPDSSFDFVLTDCPTLNLTYLNTRGFGFNIWEEINPEILDLSFNQFSSLDTVSNVISLQSVGTKPLKLKKLYLNNNLFVNLDNTTLKDIENLKLETFSVLNNNQIDCCNYSIRNDVLNLFNQHNVFTISCNDNTNTNDTITTIYTTKEEFTVGQKQCQEPNSSISQNPVYTRNLIIIICSVVGVVLFLLAGIITIVYIWKRKQKEENKLHGRSAIDFVLDQDDHQLVNYNIKEYAEYTNHKVGVEDQVLGKFNNNKYGRVNDQNSYEEINENFNHVDYDFIDKKTNKNMEYAVPTSEDNEYYNEEYDVPVEDYNNIGYENRFINDPKEEGQEYSFVDTEKVTDGNDYCNEEYEYSNI